MHRFNRELVIAETVNRPIHNCMVTNEKSFIFSDMQSLKDSHHSLHSGARASAGSTIVDLLISTYELYSGGRVAATAST